MGVTTEMGPAGPPGDRAAGAWRRRTWPRCPTRAWPPTTARCWWPCSPWPTASASSPRTSSRAASATSRSCAGWAPTSGPRVTTPSSAGSTRLSGAPVRAPDIRAGVALVLAGLVAEGETDGQRRPPHRPRLRGPGRRAVLTRRQGDAAGERTCRAADPAALLARARDGDRVALARLLSLVERGGEAPTGRGRAGLPRRTVPFTVGLDRRAGRGQVDADRRPHHARPAAAGPSPRPRRRPGRRAGGRPDVALQWRRHPRRPRAHGPARARPDRLHPLHGHPRASGGPVARRPRRRPPPRCGGCPGRHRRDRRRRPDGGRDRIGRRHDHGGGDAGLGRLHAGQQGRASWRWPTSSSSTRRTAPAPARRGATSSRCSIWRGRARGGPRSSTPPRPSGDGVAELWAAVARHRAHLAIVGPAGACAGPTGWPKSCGGC